MCIISTNFLEWFHSSFALFLLKFTVEFLSNCFPLGGIYTWKRNWMSQSTHRFASISRKRQLLITHRHRDRWKRNSRGITAHRSRKRVASRGLCLAFEWWKRVTAERETALKEMTPCCRDPPFSLLLQAWEIILRPNSTSVVRCSLFAWATILRLNSILSGTVFPVS